MSINHVTVSGNLTRDAELRNTSGGMAILTIGMAVNDRQKNRDTGEWEDYPNYVNCVMFGTRAEKLAPRLVRGSKVAISGKLRYSAWEKDGEKRSKIEVIVEEIELLSKGEGGSSRGRGNGNDGGFSGTDSLYGSDIPF